MNLLKLFLVVIKLKALPAASNVNIIDFHSSDNLCTQVTIVHAQWGYFIKPQGEY